MGVEDPDVKKVVLLLLSLKLWALMFNLELSSVLVLRRWNLSSLRGYSVDSMPTLGHTSVSSWAKTSLTPLCRMVGIASLGQLRA